MRLIHEIKVTKFFAVKTPQGISEKNESISNYSIGVDLFMPVFSTEFATAVAEANNWDFTTVDTLAIWTRKDSGTRTMTFNGERYTIFADKIQIPTGIGFLISSDYWLEIRSKSSNFKNNFTVVHGTVDMNYTYGTGCQIIAIEDGPIILEPNQKICQVVLHEAVPIVSVKEVSLEKWEQDEEVNKRRTTRTGGFGSTGKF